MKTDDQLKKDVISELHWDASINATRIGVAVNDGIVTLSGQVDNYLQKHAVERAARRVAGVRGIAVDLEVALSSEHKRSDTDIAQAALNALRWHALVPHNQITVEVEQGWVTLSGKVDWSFQAMNAEKCIRPLVGVRGVSNEIQLKQQVNPEDLRKDLIAALNRHAVREANHIKIDVDGCVVTLSGHVDSLPDHDAVIGVTSVARGVSRVIDHLEVGA